MCSVAATRASYQLNCQNNAKDKLVQLFKSIFAIREYRRQIFTFIKNDIRYITNIYVPIQHTCTYCIHHNTVLGIIGMSE